jgi:hypothetical protein
MRKAVAPKTLKRPFPLALLSFSLSCCPGTRHVTKNARHVGQEAVMLMEMPAMLEILPSC